MIVLDSSFLIAYQNTRDVHHAAAARAMVQLVAGRWGRLLLLEYVFVEVVTVILMRRGLVSAVEIGTTLLQAREIDFVPCSALFGEAFSAFRDQRTERLSLVDAAILAVARREGASIATFDGGFRDQVDVTLVPGVGGAEPSPG